ncbi:MAG: hypothetical protein A3E31_18240 [Candidatus Rokubacteria bacterium RIFCSPHIGHO2_12_FULL_73_22]|nr:MAG: hypothetical protein A3D33_16180 [Candidatus Rokubacteria bacterium RIFCSPHIGHO2_02_FULL_73_26]OGL01314.1 MAG: hypothetical protein A3E31_18240 [Candidatus Rokubacteria bacterium RIFCSPHIGHO2_12_FULL_73_22]OGL11288.1 MAG: hypothetical protein A3I14_18980 [Candidatus Rokubacteria bacterium RIFCSPLOWO2_02_FULL_73_56]OGL26153.1 MAG: hypothetical protein A3G44_15745 [Candidatus Rokubacteria bacterium RIFCSPLOWO2_12_FULL_73_47]
MTPDTWVTGPSAPSALIEDTIYTVTPVSVKVQAGIVTGEITDMQVRARVETACGRPKLTGTLRLRNTSETHSVRLVAAAMQYLDEQWRPLGLEGSGTAATFTFTAYGSERLDPGQETVQAMDVAFPARALEAGKLRGLRLEIAYVCSPYRTEMVSFAVSLVGR